MAQQRKKKEADDIYVQDFLPIKNIRNGIIETKNHKFVKLIEIIPINFNLYNEDEKDSVIQSFFGLLKTSPSKIQIKCITQKTDTEKFVSSLKKDLICETNPRTKELSKSYIELIRRIGQTVSISRRFFVAFQYEKSSRFIDSDPAEIRRKINNDLASLQEGFNQCGNAIVVTKNEDAAVGEIFYNLLNKKSCNTESFQSRVLKICKDYMASRGLVFGKDHVPNIPISNYIAPRGIDFSADSNYYIMDGMYYMPFVIKSDSYPIKVRSGWGGDLTNLGENIDIDFFFQRQSADKVLDSIVNHGARMSVSLTSKNRKSDDLAASIQSGEYIKQKLSSICNEDAYHLQTMITVCADTYEHLIIKAEETIDNLRKDGFRVRKLPYQTDKAMLSSLPLAQIDPQIEKISYQDITTSGLASMYPFTSFELSDEDGIMLGINRKNCSMCFINNFDTKKYKNANMVIMGATGSGKTFTMSCMAMRYRMIGIPCWIIAPVKGEEYAPACHAIGGEYVKISPDSPSCINILEIRPYSNRTEMILNKGEYQQGSFLAKKIQQLNTFFSLLVSDITDEEAQIMEEQCILLYNSFGITNDNKTLYNKNGTVVKMPIIGDLYNQIKDIEPVQRIKIDLARFVTGSAQSFNQQTNVDLDNKYVVFDITDLQDKLKTLGMFIVLDAIWDKTKADRSQKKAIFIDEMWVLMGSKGNRYSATFIEEIYKTIRGYGGAAIGATQDIVDYFALNDGEYGKAILNACKTKIIMGLESSEADVVSRYMSLTKYEKNEISKFERGEGLLTSNNCKVEIKIIPTEAERRFIATERSKISQIVKEEQHKY